MMNTLKWLQFAAANTLRNRRRSATTVGIAALGTAAILLSGGFALFTYQSLAEAAARTSGHLIVATRAQFKEDEDVPLQHGLDDAKTIQAALLEDSKVRQVLPRVEFSGLISNGDKSTVMVATGIDPDAEFAVKGPFLTVRAGRVLASGQRQQVLLGEGMARSLRAQPGHSLTLLASTTQGALNALDVTVAGIVSTGIPDLDKRLVLTDVVTAQELLVTTRVSSLGVFLDRLEATDDAQARVQALRPDLAVQTWVDQAFYYRGVKDLYNRIFGALGLVLGLVVVVVVTNAMAMAVIERTREVGTLRALGTLPSQLVRSFALEGLLLGSTGAALGMLLTLAVSLGLLLYPLEMPPPPGRSDPYPLQVSFDPLLYGCTVAAMLLLTTMASALVARRTTALPVTEALGHA